MIGRILGNRYELLEEIGKGGMAYVYKARCVLLNRIVAVKILRDDLEGGDEFLERFNTEAQAAASLTHSNIVSIFDVGEDEGLHYIVMEYVNGITLKEYIKEKGHLAYTEALDIAYQICDALQAAHDKNIVHRDIKPHNILITEDRNIKVADFGIARSATGNTISNNDDILGSVHYISPEQVKGEGADCRSDIYSLGISLYEMLSGQLPFDADTPVAVAMMQIDAQPQPITNVEIPKSIQQMIFKAIAKDPQMRYQNAAQFKYDMLSIIEDNRYEIPDGHLYYNPVSSEDINHDQVSEPVSRLNRIIALTGGCVTALLVVLVTIYVYNFAGAHSSYVSVPDLIGKNLDDAGKICEEYNVSLLVSDEVNESGFNPGTIVSQTPSKSEKVKDGSVVKVVINKIVDSSIDDFEGEMYKSVRDELEDNGYEVEVNFEESKSPKDSILRQSPKPGTKLKKGETITLYVSNGASANENYVSVPSLKGKTYKQAKKALEDAELNVGQISGVDKASDGDEVVSQAIPYASKVKKGTSVGLTLKSEINESEEESTSQDDREDTSRNDEETSVAVVNDNETNPTANTQSNTGEN